MPAYESGPGKHVCFDDFRSGSQHLAASTAVPPVSVGNGALSLVGQGIADIDSSALIGYGGITLTATNEAEHAIGLATGVTYKVGLMGTIVCETRVRSVDDLVTRSTFFGLTDVQTDLAILEGAIIKASSGTLTLTASDLVGFMSSSEETLATQWHGVYNGGTTGGATTSADVALGTADDATITADTFQILRLELDTNGTVRWFVNGHLKQTVVGAVSTTVALGVLLLNEEKATGNAQLLVNYCNAKSATDWAV